MHFVNRFYVASFAASSFSNRPSFHFLLNDNIRGIRKVRTGHVHGCESLSKYGKENRAKSQHGPKLVKGVLWTNVFLGYGVVSPQPHATPERYISTAWWVNLRRLQNIGQTFPIIRLTLLRHQNSPLSFELGNMIAKGAKSRQAGGNCGSPIL